MAKPRKTSTRRAVLRYDQYTELYKQAKPSIVLPELLVKDYQGIFQDFVFTSNEIDLIDARVTINEADIVELQDSHYPNLASQVQFLQQQIDGLPEFTIDTTGFTFDSTEITFDKVIA